MALVCMVMAGPDGKQRCKRSMLQLISCSCAGLVFGLVQGFLVAYMDIQPFIVTLAGMFLAEV